MNVPWRRQPPPDEMEPIEPLVMPAPPNPDFYDPAWDEWDEKRRVSPILVIVLVLVIVGIGGYVGYRTFHKSTALPLQLPTPTTFSITPQPSSPSPIVFSGKVSTLTPVFTVKSGFSVVAATCKCSASKFQVQLLEPTGKSVATLISSDGLYGSGSFAGSVPLGAPAGSYELEMSAIGPWKVTVSTYQPTQPTLPLPTTSRIFGGSGPSVIGPFAANQKFQLEWGVAQTPTPTQLQIVNSSTLAASTLQESTGTTAGKPLGISVAAQPAPFYLVQTDTSFGWGIIVQTAN